MRKLLTLSFVFLLLFSLSQCHSGSPEGEDAAVKQMAMAAQPAADDGPFANTSTGLDRYWYQGKGELSTYDLEQNRYQGTHPGQVLLVFVSEPFLPEEQVKNDGPADASATNVLKLNAITRFTTGIYDYSIMSSIFTPANTAEYPRTLKVTQSVQDWCGQVFSQVNLRENQYQQQLFSYFESEGDDMAKTTADFLEDEIPLRIRMTPDALPQGVAQVVPSMASLRMLHKPYGAYTANLSLTAYTGAAFSGDNLQAYRIEYPDFQRSITYVFQNEAPYIIEGWLEDFPSAFDRKVRQTIARRKTTKLEAYWGMNSNSTANEAARSALEWN